MTSRAPPPATLTRLRSPCTGSEMPATSTEPEAARNPGSLVVASRWTRRRAQALEGGTAGSHDRRLGVARDGGVRRRRERGSRHRLAVGGDGVRRVGRDAVGARAALDPVGQPVGVLQHVVAVAAGQHVEAQPARHHVGAGAAAKSSLPSSPLI